MHTLITKAIPLQNRCLQPWIIDVTSRLFSVVVVVYFLFDCLFVFVYLFNDVAILLESYIVNVVCLALVELVM